MGAEGKNFPGEPGHIVKITCTEMHPTYCHSEEGEQGTNTVCTQRNKYASRLGVPAFC